MKPFMSPCRWKFSDRCSSGDASVELRRRGLISGGLTPIYPHINGGRRRSRSIGAMAPKIVEGPKRGRGRPSVFDRDAALKEAMKLFWERGYQGTSFDELIAAMGISASSFYNSFGSKEALYCEATQSYLDTIGHWFFAILNDESTY